MDWRSFASFGSAPILGVGEILTDPFPGRKGL
jgi:hypothetical protein